MSTRRQFLHTAAATGAILAAPRPLLAQLGRGLEPLPSIQDPRIKALAQRAVDTARSAGASYADVRLVHTRMRWITQGVTEFEWMTVGVRALVNGYWGFAASTMWSPDEMVQLARQAAHQAKAGGRGTTRSMELAPLGQRAEGHWDMPVTIDPFTVPIEEILDYKSSIERYAMKRASARGYGFQYQSSECILVSQEKAFASTDGSYCTQRLFRSTGMYDWKLVRGQNEQMPLAMDYLPFSGVGWELYRGQPLREYTDRVIEEGIEDFMLPVKFVDVGRYETVWDASSVAQIVSATIGRATEADRVFGYEANATGTSYLNEPLEMLGTFVMGAPLLTVTANRSDAGGVTTVKWDDEGMAPHEFTLVKNGVLTDLSTTRESAGWLSAYYAKSGIPLRSHGCALGAQDLIGRGMNLPLSYTPNLVVAPGTATLDFDACVAGVAKGIAFRRMKFDMDFQQLNGLGMAEVAYEIRGGKRVARIGGAGILLRAPELWKALTTLGGEASARRFGIFYGKGEPPQWPFHSVTAVPATFKDIAVIDIQRKAS